MRRTRRATLAALASAMVVLSSCDRAPAAAPVRAESQLAGGRSLLVCRGGSEKVFTETVGVDGAQFGGAGVEILIPAGALDAPTEFVVRVPESTYSEVEVTANGQEHFEFLKPVIIALDYSRCGRYSGVDLSVWHIDTASRELLENMGGIDDALEKRIIFSTLHLSGYAIVN